MILQFPDVETLRLALTGGLIPPEAMQSQVSAATAGDGRLTVETEARLPRKAAAELAGLAVAPVKRHVGEPATFSCWPQLLPVARDPQPPKLSNQAPVLFELESATDLPTLVGEMLRLGNDRQSVRWLTSAADGAPERALLRVVGPPYYTLLRALDRTADDTAGGVRAYFEQSPRVWVQLGHTHPLADKIDLTEGQLLLIRPDNHWTYLTDEPFRDVYEVVEFRLPATRIDWTESPVREKLSVPLRLVPGNAADDPELWVLRTDAADVLDTFVRDADERIVQRLKFAVARSAAGQDVIVLRTTASRAAPPPLTLPGAVGFKPYYKLPNLYVPAGTRLHPTLRRDAVRKLLAEDVDSLVWLYPGANGSFTPEVIPEDSFRPLEDWVDYVVESNREPLTTWVESSLFDFEHFICNESQPPKPPKGKEEAAKPRRRPRGDEPLTQTAPTKGKTPGEETATPAPPAGDSPPAARPRPPGEWLLRRQQLEDRFRAVEGPLDHPERQALWPALAEANTGYGATDEAAVCWLNALWGRETAPREWVEGWLRSEVPGLTRPPTAPEFDRRLKQADPDAWEVRQFAATFLALSTQSPVPDWLRSRLPAVQRYLEAHERKLPIRAVWLAATRLATLAGADTLGLARTRDRLLQRLLEEGVKAERDLPGFLRYAGTRDSERVRLVQKQALDLHGDVRAWTEASLKQPTQMGLSDQVATLAYVDLMFAFGLAKLGESDPARRLVESARRTLEAYPADEDRGIAGRLLFRAFAFRIDEALNGKPHGGPLDPRIKEEIEQIHQRANGKANNPYGLAHYVINRMRQQSRVLEPQEKLDPYSEWMRHGDEVRKALAELPKLKDPALLARTVRDLYRAGAGGARATPESRFFVLHESLPLAVRVGEQFTFELIELVPDALKGSTSATAQIAEYHKKQGQLLERALFLAAHFDRRDVVQQLVSEFVQLLKAKPEEQRYELVNVVAAQSLRSLRKLGLRDEIDRFLHRMQEVVLGGLTAAELREKLRARSPATRPDVWAKALQSLLHLAGGWLTFGLADQAEPILNDARAELLDLAGPPLPPSAFTDVAQAYVAALGHGPAESGLPRIAELFRTMSPARVTNTLTSAKFYSRFHLNLVEETVLAIVSDDFALGPAGRRWLDEDEFLVRRRVHQDMKRHLARSGLDS